MPFQTQKMPDSQPTTINQPPPQMYMVFVCEELQEPLPNTSEDCVNISERLENTQHQD